jgi:enterochelin esterase-like enzyme
MQNIFGAEPRMKPEADDLFVLAERTAALPAAERPRVFTCCGREDFLYTQNRSFKALMETLPYDYRWQEWPGVHNWTFFDTAIQRALAFFFGDGKPCPS